jgi:hypothetical protein
MSDSTAAPTIDQLVEIFELPDFAPDLSCEVRENNCTVTVAARIVDCTEYSLACQNIVNIWNDPEFRAYYENMHCGICKKPCFECWNLVLI